MSSFLKSLLEDETYIKLWRWVVQKTEGHRAVIFFLAIIILAYKVSRPIAAMRWRQATSSQQLWVLKKLYGWEDTSGSL